jgi:general secretion pathway protein D
LVAAAAWSLNACSPGLLEERHDGPQDAADAVRAANLQPRFPSAPPPTQGVSAPWHGFSIFGSDSAATAKSSDPSAASAGGGPPGAVEVDDGVTLNFENTPISSVAKVVLGDIMGVGYVVDPRAQGTISLSSGRPIPKKSVLFVLESALKANNLAMIREGGTYRISPANDGSVGPLDPSGAEPGYGLTAIPLQYVSGATISRLLEGFAARPGAIRTDASGTVLIVIGSGAERQAAIDTVRSFDVDWLRGQSVGMYPVHNSEPEPVVAELEKIMDSGESGLGHGLVKLQPVPQQNAILVVSTRADLLRSAAQWIERLDAPNSAASSVRVYKVRFGDAKQIAQVLNGIFGSGSSASTSDTATNQLAPNSGSSTLSSQERLTGGRSASNGNANGSSQDSSQPASAQTGLQGNTGGSASAFGGLQSSALANAFAASSGGGSGNPVLPNVRITADTINNSLLIYANEESYRLIERTLNQIDRPKLQVAIDVTIAEVTLNDSLNYGVQFYLQNRLGTVLNTQSGAAVPIASAPAGFNIMVGNNATPNVIINALHSLTDVRILSNPSLVVMDNQQASFEVGDQVPISTGSATVLTTSNTVVNTVDYKNTGIILQVQPRVNADNSVVLDIDQEISSVPQGSTSLTPTISERKVKSSVSVVNGQMVLLAGLVSDSVNNSRSGIPGLTQLPWVGGAFGSTTKADGRTELIILIRPTIIRDGVDASMVAEELRAKMRSGRTNAFSLPAALNVETRGSQ